MEDKLTLFLFLLSLVPLVAIVYGVVRELNYQCGVRRKMKVANMAHGGGLAEYDSVLAATRELEMDFQQNTGVHHTEQTYLNRSELIRKQTHWYDLINSL